MARLRLRGTRNLLVAFARRYRETIAIYVAVAFFPIVIAAGAGVDCLRVINYRAAMQAALEAAVLSGAKDGSPRWTVAALDAFNAHLAPSDESFPRPTFALDPATGNYTGAVTDSLPTSILGVLSISSISVSAAATAVAGESNAFILDPGQSSSKSRFWTATNVSGSALLIVPPRQQTRLVKGTVLKPGSKIVTGQYGQALLSRGRETILLTSNSMIALPEATEKGMSTTIHQWSGSILLAVERRNEKHFEVVTPYLSAVVKGTQFRVTVNGNDATVEVLRGQVEVADNRSGQLALVNPGQTAKVFARGPAHLALSGSGTLSPILRGPPRQLPLDAAASSAFSSIDDSLQRDSSPSFGFLRGIFGDPKERRNADENATLAFAFACAVGVIVAVIVAARRRRRRWE